MTISSARHWHMNARLSKFSSVSPRNLRQVAGRSPFQPANFFRSRSRRNTFVATALGCPLALSPPALNLLERASGENRMTQLRIFRIPGSLGDLRAAHVDQNKSAAQLLALKDDLDLASGELFLGRHLFLQLV